MHNIRYLIMWCGTQGVNWCRKLSDNITCKILRTKSNNFIFFLSFYGTLNYFLNVYYYYCGTHTKFMRYIVNACVRFSHSFSPLCSRTQFAAHAHVRTFYSQIFSHSISFRSNSQQVFQNICSLLFTLIMCYVIALAGF